eukprot:COSAG05_NODE_1041_length_6067_cov_116.470845_7_plen_68_part_00
MTFHPIDHSPAMAVPVHSNELTDDELTSQNAIMGCVVDNRPDDETMYKCTDDGVHILKLTVDSYRYD